jgi:tRNA(fMet)-specific endonuclease VapC
MDQCVLLESLIPNATEFEGVDGELAGAIRADLERVGKPTGAYDLLIAGRAMRNKLTLITANLSEFAPIKTLAWADSSPSR